MSKSLRSRTSVLLLLVVFVTITGGLMAGLALTGVVSHTSAKADNYAPASINCSTKDICLDPTEPYPAGEEYGYVGHDEPSNLFYSNSPGSGNRNLWLVKLPKDPTLNPKPSSRQTLNFELHPAFWFGMAMCDTQSYPLTVSTCKPDSDSNIVDPAVSANHPGTAFMEMQFYPPGWAPFQLAGGISCAAKQWCAALNIDSFSENGVTGVPNNDACLSTVGIEPVNFAFITKNGISQAPANPVDSTLATFTPDPKKDLFMNSGDLVVMTMHDTPQGLRIDLFDSTSHQHGSMTASASNRFGQVKYDPSGTTCTNIPYNFHPMYSTSSPATRVIWAAHSYNIAFSDEIGHFDFCSTVNSDGSCSGTEGRGTNKEPTDGDDVDCQPASASMLYQVNGCAGENDGYDGASYYKNDWPGGDGNLTPTPVQFTSPLTGHGYNVNYTSSAFESDQPRDQVAGIGISHNNCIRTPPTTPGGPPAGRNCFLIPLTDDSPIPATAGGPTPLLAPAPLVAASFYPYYSTTSAHIQIAQGLTLSFCMWQFGGEIPGAISNFGKIHQFGTYLPLHYLPVGSPLKIDNFQGVQSVNPCQVQPQLSTSFAATILGG
ncbi:MAG TPA: hypothetical protein VEH81_14690 [Ktedonobacteraceae bacterium]|nr:hypothetical protein [Ktedonobacteraceae bacterium]